MWVSYIVPKFALISWMAILNRLPTMDRMQAWGMEVTGICVLCKQGCNFSKNIWKEIMEMCGLKRELYGWEEELKWAYQKLKGKSLLSIILRGAWIAFIYFA